MPNPPVPPATASSGDAPPRSWVRRITKGGQLTETCPLYCTDTHFNDDSGAVDNLTHGFYFDGPELPLFDPEQGSALVPVLAGRVEICPYSTNRKERAPHLVLEPVQDEVIENLSPDEFAEIIAKIRAQCDVLDEIHARFVTIHAEWTETAS
ncbi:hypothetical protein [Streptomyces sp. BPTC-684]|uniref:DUF6907 domain-containing protein n=1 Tax=Streptomyces sp. BPTC-684 TaxID=3043734 RepID=UPI0024B0E691|nr:hypothetical protein [Streptomyces sp. BPTC-684]WHM37548.1 hypothetical protein QIY60_11970 [Streptomyces sp. BPTC-684]